MAGHAKRETVKEPLVHITKRGNISSVKAWSIRIAIFIIALLFCGVVAFLLIDKLRSQPSRIGEFYSCFYLGAFGTERRIWKFLKNVAILLGFSLAVTPAFRMKFWNIGAEGQTLVGVLSAIAMNFYFGGKVPDALLLIMMLLAALAAGAVWALIPALFKAKWNTNETLFTLMMNYVATNLVAFFLVIWVPNGSSSLAKLKFGALPKFGPKLGQNYLFIILVIAALTALLYIYLFYSKNGYEINVVGESENTARYIGINVKKVIIRTMAISGLLCGLVGFLIAGLDQSVTVDSAGGQGFTAIMVSWMAKFNPFAMVLAAGLITLLNQGADQISTVFDVSESFPSVMVGIILFFIISSEFFLSYQLHFRKKHPGVSLK